MADRYRLNGEQRLQKTVPNIPIPVTNHMELNEDSVPGVPLPILRVRKRPARPRPAASYWPDKML